MRLLLLAILLLSTTPPPLGFHAERGEGRILIGWSQQSDANVVCIEQAREGVVTPRGCVETVYGIRLIDLPDAPDGTQYTIYEWRRSVDNAWTYYSSTTAALPYRVFVPLVNR